jgi:hypothetical protein
MRSPEELARENIDNLLAECGWTMRVLFLVDRGNLGDQTLIRQLPDQQFVRPDDGRKFTELYNVQHLQSSQLDKVSRLCISTIQRLYSMLRSFFFWDRNTDAARRDQHEETGDALAPLHQPQHGVHQRERLICLVRASFACAFATRIYSYS